MKTRKTLLPAALMWLVILIAYTITLIQLPGNPGVFLLVAAGVICIGAAQTWSAFLTANA